MNRREFIGLSTTATLSAGFASGMPRALDREMAGENGRVTLSLNGRWEVEDSVSADAMPGAFTHSAPIPGLAHSAEPAFPDVDKFQSRQLLFNLMGKGRISKAEYEKLGNAPGLSQQKRNYFWYRRSFIAPPQAQVALLRINKAQFGTVAFLNGVRIGEHYPCFTSVTFDITRAVRWSSPNELVIRIGAHPGVLPSQVVAGTDYEKNRWTPGIYDDVTVLTMNNPVISSVQVAPRIAESAVLVQTELHNFGDRLLTAKLSQQVAERSSRAAASAIVEMSVEIPPGESKTIMQRVAISHPHLWSPEDPFLYTLATSTGGDTEETRFGMREFRFDTATQRAYLNGRPYFLRGSNVTLHRFFEDPQVGTLPWDEAWLHRLLAVIPRELHWNAFRFCIGPVPDRWLQIADEQGLLIQNEYFVWVGNPTNGEDFSKLYDADEMTREYSEWMRDNWNHPSVVIWDASNESWLPAFDAIINKVRGRDLSGRPWENSYNSPAGWNDPVEDHQYLFYSTAMNRPTPPANDQPPQFKLEDLEALFGPPGAVNKTSHAMILNEYGWLWLNRDGSPTLLTEQLYSRLLPGGQNTTENRLHLQAYILGGLTEFWRAYRRYAGVLHFVYLTSSEPDSFTADHFQDVKSLTLHPAFAASMEQAFRPLGVYLDFWRPALSARQKHRFSIALVNDKDRARTGRLRLSFINAAGAEAAAAEMAFSIGALGAATCYVEMSAPDQSGVYSLRAAATPADELDRPTVSRRAVSIEAATA